MDDKRKKLLNLFGTLMNTAGEVSMGMQLAETRKQSFDANKTLKRDYKSKFLPQAEECYNIGERLKSAMYRADRELFDVLEDHIMNAIKTSKSAIRFYKHL